MTPELLQAAAVKVEHLEHGCEQPDVGERHVGELATPLRGIADTTEQRLNLVAETFPEVKAGVGQFPHAINAVGTFRFGKDILKFAL